MWIQIKPFQHLVALKAKRAEIRKRLQEAQKRAAQESNNMSGVPPPPPPSQTKQSLWIQATTEEGAVYYYNKETRYGRYYCLLLLSYILLTFVAPSVTKSIYFRLLPFTTCKEYEWL